MAKQTEYIKHIRLIHFSIITACAILITTVYFVRDKDLESATKQITEIDRIVREWDDIGLIKFIEHGMDITGGGRLDRGISSLKKYVTVNKKENILIFERSYKDDVYNFGFLVGDKNSPILNYFFKKEAHGFYSLNYKLNEPSKMGDFIILWESLEKILMGYLLDVGYVYFCDGDFKNISDKYKIESKNELSKSSKVRKIMLKLRFIGENTSPLLKYEGFEARCFLVGDLGDEGKQILIPMNFSKYRSYFFSGQSYFRTLITKEKVDPEWVFFPKFKGIEKFDKSHSYLTREIPIGKFKDSFRSLYPYAIEFRDLKISDLKTVMDYFYKNPNRKVTLLGISFPISSLHTVGWIFIILLQLYFLFFISNISTESSIDSEALSFPWIGLLKGSFSQEFSIITFAILPLFTVTILQLYPVWGRELLHWNPYNLLLLIPIGCSGALAYLTWTKYNEWVTLVFK